MTASGVPVVTLTASKRRTRFGWKCSCKEKAHGLRSRLAAEINADGHCLVAHPGGWTIERGAA